MRHVGNVGPYRLEYDDSLSLADDVQHTDKPPFFHISWLPVEGVAFAMHVLANRAPTDDPDGRKWAVIVDGAQSEQASQFFATQLRDIDGTLAIGITFAARRLTALGGRYQGHAVMVEHYIGRAYDDIIDLTYRFHDDHIQAADQWRGIFHQIVGRAIVQRD